MTQGMHRMTCLREGEPLHGALSREQAPVSILLEPKKGGVALSLFPNLPRPEVHLPAVRATFEERQAGA